MYRAWLLDRAMRATAFSHPEIAALVRDRFVPLRMCADETASTLVGVRAFDFVEPGFIVLSAEGRVLHAIDRIRTFNSDWILSALAAVSGRPAPAPSESARLRRLGRFEDALGASPGAVDRCLALLALERFDEARAALSPDGGPEALYHLSAIDAWTGKDPAPALRRVTEAHPGSPWAWRAAANLVRADDGLPEGPLAHHLEDYFAGAPEGVPASTRRPASDAPRGGLRFLLRAQHADGAWRDARYAYWPDPRILPNVWMAVTALAARALVEHRDLDPVRVDAALARADAFLKSDGNLAPGHHEESYAQAYRLHYFVRRGDAAAAAKIVARIAAIQDAQGHWPHEYPNPFSTAAVVHALASARKAGLEVPSALLARAAVALKSTRAPDGRQAYRVGQDPDNPKSSSSRTALCELALWECGEGPLENVRKGLEGFWAFANRLDAVRTCDYHSDGRLAGFFWFHASWHAMEAARAAGDADSLRRLRDRIPPIAEIDGGFVDSHELGKSYATASALLILAGSR
jgi:hypothetical protein